MCAEPELQGPPADVDVRMVVGGFGQPGHPDDDLDGLAEARELHHEFDLRAVTPPAGQLLQRFFYTFVAQDFRHASMVVRTRLRCTVATGVRCAGLRGGCRPRPFAPDPGSCRRREARPPAPAKRRRADET